MLCFPTEFQMPNSLARYFRALGAIALLTMPLAAGSALAAPAEKVRLAESPTAAERTQTGVQYEIGGHLLMRRDAEVKKLPMRVAAKLGYHDAQVKSDDHVEDDALSINRQFVRHYDKIETEIQIQDAKFAPQLRPERRVIGSSIVAGERTTFSPSGHLTREELDLVETLGDSQLLSLLLPTEKVALGDTWKVAEQSLALLLHIDAVGQTDVQCVLAEIDDERAKIEAAGTVHGAISGVATEIELKIRLEFDRQAELVTRMELVVKETRAIGHAGPGVDVVAKLRLQRRSMDTPAMLTDSVIKTVAFPAPEELTNIDFAASNGRFSLLHDREWHVTGDQPQVTVLRMIRRGELMAQCNVTPLSARVEGVPTTLEAFRNQVQKTLGDRFVKFLESGKAEDDGVTIFRVVVEGNVSDLPIRWSYYLMRGEGDEMLSLSFTVEGELVKKFGKADEQLVNRLKLLAPQQPTPVTASKVKSVLKR